MIVELHVGVRREGGYDMKSDGERKGGSYVCGETGQDSEMERKGGEREREVEM